MSQYWSPVVSKLTPYVAGEQPKVTNLIKLNTNESPFGPSPLAMAAMRAAVDENLRLYPDPEGEPLRSTVADYYHLNRDQVFVGNSSDEVLAFCFQALLKQQRPLLFPNITYNFYPSYCRLFGIEFQLVPLRDNFELALDDFPSANGGIIFANPNAPTGLAVSLQDIEKLLQRNTDSVVVVDEAYVDFGADTAAPLISKYPNLLVVQTFSKSRALAGLRVGFALGDVKLIEGMERVKNSFNAYLLDRIAIAGATAALKDQTHFEKIRDEVINNRQRMSERLIELGFDVPPSKANFIYCRHPNFDALQIAQQLRQQNIIVRHFKQAPIDQWLRISIGNKQECEAFLKVTSEIVAAGQ